MYVPLAYIPIPHPKRSRYDLLAATLDWIRTMKKRRAVLDQDLILDLCRHWSRPIQRLSEMWLRT